uniref:DUF4806 domain-containing protein n=1 Tax=Sander lucioperca TaxID=283035 RepID=A0A8C9ZIS3_SANLU
MFHIVIFESTNEVEVVPAIWVKDNTCMWPPYKHDEIVKAVRSQEPTGPHWIPYKVRKILTTYEEARVKLPEAERFTDLTDSEDSPKRKRRRLLHAYNVYTYLYYIDTISSNVFALAVIRTILTNQEVIKEQMGILVKLVYDLKGTAEESSSLPLETFPMASLHDLQVLEGQLQDQEFKKNLVIGGTAVKDTVWRMMGFLLTNQVARQLNWKGVNGKGAFKTLTLKGVINEAVRRNRLTATSTDQEVEQWVKRWLHLAGDRDGGRRARQRATNNLV